MASKPELVRAAEDVLKQGLDLFALLDAQKYALIARDPFRASIGGHYRHVIEHFQCLIDGVATDSVNYDARKRDARIENELQIADKATQDVLSQLGRWDTQILARRCSTINSIAYHSQDASIIDSNFARELAYCIGHAIHHYAIIRLICSEVGVLAPAEFGYAPSTIRHQSSLAAD